MALTNEQGKFSIEPKTLTLVAAFAAVYLIWGSTYLAIKYAIETMPPFLMAGTRFFMAGSILFIAAARAADFEMPRREHWKTSFIVGTLLLLGGNGLVVFAQHYISSSLAALLIATEPFFIVILSWLWLKNGKPGFRVAAGLVVGFVGVALLILGQTNGGVFSGGSGQLIGSVAIIGAALSWATGSIYGLKAPVPKSSLLTAGMQMLAGGTVLLAVSLVTGEVFSFDIAAVSARSWAAVAYLLVFGSLVGFTAYSWLLKNAQPSLVATYAYVNPVVAVLLGWGIAGEALTPTILIGAAIVVASVALVTFQKGPRKTQPKSEPVKSAESAATGEHPLTASA